jgi:sulfhydrogenase subunit alpha
MAERNLDINVEYLTRVEGHGNIVVDMKKGILEKCELQIVEAPRFFEALLLGRSMFEAQHLTSRICGICSTTHSLASVKASEDAAGINVSRQTVELRKLLLNYEILDSHILHVYFLVAPDLFGKPSIIPMLESSHKPEVLRALRMKKHYSDLFDIMAERHTHPISICPRGFTKVPSPLKLEKMKEILKCNAKDMEDAVELFRQVKFPDFERETEFVATTHPEEYGIYEGNLISSDMDGEISPSDYLDIVHEYHVPHSTAKHSKNKRDSYMVGALARTNLNFDFLHEKAKDAAQSLGFSVPCYNTYMNSVAQLVEMVHCIYNSLEIIEEFITNGIDEDDIVSSWPSDSETPYRTRAGTGVGIVEAPRGTLIHEYTIDEKANIQNANCIIPTNQNLANADLDLRKLVPQIKDRSQDEITLACEMLVRAYDPCISCSSHFLKVEYK